jgi:hypothetical protein
LSATAESSTRRFSTTERVIADGCAGADRVY